MNRFFLLAVMLSFSGCDVVHNVADDTAITDDTAISVQGCIDIIDYTWPSNGSSSSYYRSPLVFVVFSLPISPDKILIVTDKQAGINFPGNIYFEHVQNGYSKLEFRGIQNFTPNGSYHVMVDPSLCGGPGFEFTVSEVGDR